MLISDINNILTLVADIARQQLALADLAKASKPAFREFIADQNVPLEERWTLWVSAPVEMKEVEAWIEHLTLDGEEICWFEGQLPYSYSKYQVVDMVEMIDSLDVDEYATEDGGELEAYFFGTWQVNDLKEQILAKNLHSFTLDW